MKSIVLHFHKVPDGVDEAARPRCSRHRIRILGHHRTRGRAEPGPIENLTVSLLILRESLPHAARGKGM